MIALIAVATCVIVAGCTVFWPIKATYPQQIPKAAKLVAPPGFVDDTAPVPNSRMMGDVWIGCVGAYTFGCHPVSVYRAWKSVEPLSTTEACRRFGTWSYDHGLRVLTYATYTGGDQKWNDFKVPEPSAPKFKQFVTLCVDEVLGTHDHEGQGARLDGSPSDLLHPDRSWLIAPSTTDTTKALAMGASFPIPVEPLPSGVTQSLAP